MLNPYFSFTLTSQSDFLQVVLQVCHLFNLTKVTIKDLLNLHGWFQVVDCEEDFFLKGGQLWLIKLALAKLHRPKEVDYSVLAKGTKKFSLLTPKRLARMRQVQLISKFVPLEANPYVPVGSNVVWLSFDVDHTLVEYNNEVSWL